MLFCRNAVECFIQVVFSLSRSLPLFLSFWLLVFALVSLVPMDFRRDARHFFGAILWLVRPSVAVLLPGSASGALCSECCLMLYPFF